MKKGLINNKRGIQALDIPLKVMGVVFGIVILAFLIIVVAGNLRETDPIPYEPTIYVSNETLTTVTETGENLKALTTSNCSAICSNHLYYDAGNTTEVNSGNYTTSNSGCTIATNSNTDSWLNNSDIDVQHSLRT